MTSGWKCLAIGLAVAAAPSTIATATESPLREPIADPASLYGEEISFDVYRKGEKTGRHTIRFGREGLDVNVSIHFHLQIDILFITAYRFDYWSDSLWRDGRLHSLKIRVDDDGDPFSLAVDETDGGYLSVASSSETYRVDPPLYPTDHWNPGVLSQNRVLNTLTGHLNQVTITPMGRETVPTESGPVTATHYAYSGDLEDTEVWYDDQGRWVKMRFKGRDGSTIDYRCRRCQGSKAAGEAAK